MFGNILNSFAEHRNELLEQRKPRFASLDIYRLRHLEKILWLFENTDSKSLKEPEDRHSYGTALECMVGYSDLLIIDPRLSESRL